MNLENLFRFHHVQLLNLALKSQFAQQKKFAFEFAISSLSLIVKYIFTKYGFETYSNYID